MYLQADGCSAFYLGVAVVLVVRSSSSSLPQPQRHARGSLSPFSFISSYSALKNLRSCSCPFLSSLLTQLSSTFVHVPLIFGPRGYRACQQGRCHAARSKRRVITARLPSRSSVRESCPLCLDPSAIAVPARCAQWSRGWRRGWLRRCRGRGHPPSPFQCCCSLADGRGLDLGDSGTEALLDDVPGQLVGGGKVAVLGGPRGVPASGLGRSRPRQKPHRGEGLVHAQLALSVCA